MRQDIHRLLRDDRGAVAVYIALTITALIGMMGLAIDSGRLFVTNTQAQAAADAAALAAASQLNGRSDAIARATQAAQTTPLVANRQTFAQGDEVISITGIRFFSTLSGNVVTTDGTQARFVEVTTQSLTQQTLLVRIVAAGTATTSATAVAGWSRTACQIAPLMMCISGTNFDPAQWRGRQILLKEHGGGNAPWGPGDFGFIDPPEGNQGSGNLAEALATAHPVGCYNGSSISLDPGQKTSATRNALNTRFDIYGGSGSTGFSNSWNDPTYAPDRNVTQSGRWTANPASGHYDYCSGRHTGSGKSATDYAWTYTGGPADGNVTRDQDISESNRVGNGLWDCATYWNNIHPGVTPPSGCTHRLATSTGYPRMMTRYQMYRYELDNGIPAAGAPHCNTNTSSDPERRVIYFAVFDCGAIAGNASTPVAAWVKAFLTEPVGDSLDIYAEVIDIAQPNDGSGRIHDIVQLYR